ncbi:MAG: DEDD exonuclease domain-containing protein [Bacteroidota bacterium]
MDLATAIDKTTFVVTDTETTGARAGEDRLIELAAVKLRGGQIVGTFQHLINPERHIPQRITRLTGITTAMVYEQPTAAEVLPGYLDFLGDGLLVAHNLPFDQRFLDVELDLAGLPPMTNEALCTLRLARRLLSALPSKGLAALTAHYGLKNDARHRALGDATVTAHVLLRLLDQLRIEFGATTIADVLAFQRKRYKDTRRAPKHLEKIRQERLPLLPDRPGVYFMKDRRDRVIYVGKAKSLRNRVRSYFTGIEAHPPKTRKLLRDVRDVHWTETGSELRALLDESRLIKQMLPVYNRAQRRYRSYPFLRLDTTHRFPTLSQTPIIRNDGAEYYGPIGRRGQAEELLELVGRLFQLRECEEPTFRMGRACLYHEMGRCTAPCEGGHGAARYGDVVEQVRRFLTGKDDSALEIVEQKMRQAAARLDFEEAGFYRDQYRRLERTLGRQQHIASAVHDHHAVLVEPGLREGDVQLFVIRHGRLVAMHDLPVPPSPDDEAALEALLAEHFDPSVAPPDVIGKADVDQTRILLHWMHRHPDRARQIRWHDGDDLDAMREAILETASHSAAHQTADLDAEGDEA